MIASALFDFHENLSIFHVSLRFIAAAAVMAMSKLIIVIYFDEPPAARMIDGCFICGGSASRPEI